MSGVHGKRGENLRIWGACVLAVILNAAMLSDFLTGKIKNNLIAAGFILGLAYQLQVAGIGGIRVFAGGVLLPFVLTFPLFAFGAVGAGDVKLLAVAGAFLGMEAMPECLLWSLLLGGAAAFLKMLRKKSFSSRFSYLASYVGQSLRENRWRPYGQPFQEEDAVIHLSVCILFAVLICIIGGAI